jgi:hypothetical protein
VDQQEKMFAYSCLQKKKKKKTGKKEGSFSNADETIFPKMVSWSWLQLSTPWQPPSCSFGVVWCGVVWCGVLWCVVNNDSHCRVTGAFLTAINPQVTLKFH